LQSEANIQREIMVALSHAGCLVWRNNVGALTDATGRLVKYGLCKGSSDLIGLTPCGKFLAIEVKSAKGRATLDQERFIAAVRSKGGRAGVARSVKEALEIANVIRNEG
jgi:hypothetical protein